MLVPLGFNCNVTYLNQALCIKKETGVFEWFDSRRLQRITDVIECMTRDPSCNVVHASGASVCLLHPDLFSNHYDTEEFRPIFARRYQRFLEIVKTQPRLFFVRVNPYQRFTYKEEIERFAESIHRINSRVMIVFLLIDTIQHDSEKKILSVERHFLSFHHRFFYKKDMRDILMRPPNRILYEQYKQMLKDIGYDVDDVYKQIFHDKS
jgi:hypothetical protein